MSAQFTEIRFQQFHNTPLGQELWQFLLKPMSLRSLVVATHLNKPAISGVSDLLIQQFGSTTGTSPKERLVNGLDSYQSGYDLNYIKRYLGISVKLILKDLGYTVLRKNCSSGDPLGVFNKGTKYTFKPSRNL